MIRKRIGRWLVAPIVFLIIWIMATIYVASVVTTWARASDE